MFNCWQRLILTPPSFPSAPHLGNLVRKLRRTFLWRKWEVQTTQALAHAGTFTRAAPPDYHKTPRQILFLLAQAMFESTWENALLFPNILITQVVHLFIPTWYVCGIISLDINLESILSGTKCGYRLNVKKCSHLYTLS